MIRIKSLKLIRLLVKESKTEIVIGGTIPKTSKIKLLLGLLVEKPK
jgi:hypothetical protein